MRLVDHDEPIDPEVAAVLDAIDATLAGEPVDAQFADMAEIALLLSSERPRVRPEFARSMDERVGRRFAPVAAPVSRRRRWFRSEFWQATGALAAGVAMIAAIVLVAGGGHGASSSSSSEATSGLASSAAASSAATSPSTAASHPAPQVPSATSSGSKAEPPLVPPTGSASGSTAVPTLQPPTSGRKVVQGAQLNLAAAPNRIDDVAQEVYNVVGVVNGIVESSTVTQTGGSGGYAEFQLSVPSGSLGQAMSRLSSLNDAQVLSRTDSSQDITEEYGAAQRRLADARALRTSLLKQLTGATTTAQIDSLKVQIRDAEASISSDQATLNRMNHQVGFSQLSVEIAARSAAAPATHRGGGGFGIGSAAHDAGRVLTVAAGVALIAIAALMPIAMLAALAWWAGAAIRRRRRAHALDAA